MYYKVMKDNKVIDVLDKLIFLKYQKKHNIMLICKESEAQAILSSNKKYVWHEETLYKVPIEAGEYDTVQVQEIDRYEYDKLKILNGHTAQEIIDDFVYQLIETGVL